MSNIMWNHAEVRRAAKDAAYASATLSGVSLSSPATGSEAQATLNEKMQGLKQAISKMAETVKNTGDALTTADKNFRDNETYNAGKIIKAGRYPDNSAM